MAFFKRKEIKFQIKDEKEIRSIFQFLVENGRDILFQVENGRNMRVNIVGEEPELIFFEMEDVKRKQWDLKIDDHVALKLIFEGKSYSGITKIRSFGSFNGIHGMCLKQPEYLNREDKHDLTSYQIVPPIKCWYTTSKMDPVEGYILGVGTEGIEIKGGKERISDNLYQGCKTFIEVTLPSGGPHLKYETEVSFIERKTVAGCRFLKATPEQKYAIRKWINDESEKKRRERIKALKTKVTRGKEPIEPVPDQSVEETVPENSQALCDNELYWIAVKLPEELKSPVIKSLRRTFGILSVEKVPEENTSDIICGVLVFIKTLNDFNKYSIDLSDKLNLPVVFCGPCGEEKRDWTNQSMLHGGLDFIETNPFSGLKAFQACKKAYEMFYGHEL